MEKTLEEKIKYGLNTGILPPPNLKQAPKQFFGGAIPFVKRLEDGYWRQYRSRFEDQNHGGVDKMDCVSESCTNVVEAQINWMIATNQIETEPIKEWLDENGKFESSQRALAKQSGTSANGNSQMVVGDTLKNFGLIPEKNWPTPRGEVYMSWAEFYKTIPANLTAKGKTLLKYFNFVYERIGDTSKENFIKQKQHAPLWVAIGTCSGWSYQNIITACTMSPNHAQTIDGHKINEYWDDLDHYDPYEKKLAWNYKIYYPYKLVVNPLPSILKKGDEGETMKLYKAPNQGAKVFVIGGIVVGNGDELYHHLDFADDVEAKAILGENYDSNIVQLDTIPETQVGFAITSKKKLFSRLLEFFNSFRGIKK